MPRELYIPYSKLKPLAPTFPLVRRVAEQHIMNEYDGVDQQKDKKAGLRRTRAQYLDFGTRYGAERMQGLIQSFLQE